MDDATGNQPTVDTHRCHNQRLGKISDWQSPTSAAAVTPSHNRGSVATVDSDGNSRCCSPRSIVPAYYHSYIMTVSKRMGNLIRQYLASMSRKISSAHMLIADIAPSKKE
ncbi:hypothetical protein Y032_0099g3220 [Ancylostoma ceylanicum]|uniref:Uncharacterized protein n=1 Tax=Ancylostoma ceylanicum TaxID=53326 RepID=A0A016TJ04_9BILA|nr:hypothetical protein Y032_0099g3220 [Ancylostoma ceylanicum]